MESLAHQDLQDNEAKKDHADPWATMDNQDIPDHLAHQVDVDQMGKMAVKDLQDPRDHPDNQDHQGNLCMPMPLEQCLEPAHTKEILIRPTQTLPLTKNKHLPY